jgi:N-methylhydantoinase B
MTTATDKFDPITIEIIQSSLTAISDEMFATMRKTAMSSIIYEVLDFGVAITDAKGDLASSGAGIPAFVGMLDSGVRSVIDKFDQPGAIRPGDIFTTNDPHAGGVSHMNDVVIILPVFAGEEIIAWVANKAHWVDIGGMSPGSLNPEATEIFQEGLRLPAIKLFENGEPIPSVLDIITANTRLPETTLGDLWAGIASMRAGERRLLQLVEKYGKDTVLHALSSYMDYAESVARRALAELPKGTFLAEDQLDDGRKLVAKVTISDDEFTVDLRGNPPQDAGPFNCSYMATMVGAQVIFKSITSPQTVANAGTFRLISLICDERSMFNAAFPAAMGFYYESAIRVMDIIWKALAPHMPDRLTAGHYSSVCGTIIGGTHPDTGQPHSFIEPEIGGWGAGQGKDGDNAQYTGFHGETYNCPVEVNEARNGIFIDQFRLSDAPGGAGEFRGGKGIILDYRIRGENSWITAMYTRSKIPPWGVNDGGFGSLNLIDIIRKDGSTTTHDTLNGLALAPDDVVRVRTANGGGYGDPKKRDRQAVLDDIKNEYITSDEAKEVYGVTD